ncbi:MAG: hypothetical protein E6R08_10920 [Nevskiaceae bacterium]|nr:MAG: hypothetical protein E6R08_10920 [Nevskiaceae bacterium]
MATDSTNVPQTEASAGNDHQEFNPENIQLAQANTGGAQQPAAGAAPQADIPGVPNGSVNVAFPDGQNIVRVQVAPGETISIPFDGDLAAKFGEEGNLAIKVGDRTIILQGYAEANQETGVTLKDESGDDIDVASVIAATDPNLDIQTAAGGAAGGSVGGSGFFSPFTNAGELGGLGELGVLGQTELNYGLIQPDANILLQEPDTDPTLVSITFDITGGFVNEDDLGGGAPQQSNFAVLDIGGGHDIGGDLLARLGQNVGEGFWSGGWKDGNDAFDTDDHEAGSQTDSQEGADGDGIGVHSDDHNGVDQDREPTTAKATVTVDFHGDVPGKISFSNGTNVPAITQLANQHLTSHGHELQYALLPAANGQGEMIVAYYSEDGINHLVFTVGIEEASGATSVSAFHIDYTEYDAVDNVGDAADILNVGVPFFMSDSDGSVVAVPSGPNGLTFQIIDDVPELGHVQYGEDGSAQNIVHADLTIGHDESAHSQHTSYQGADGQTHHTDDAGYISADDANNMVKDGLAGNSAVSGLIGSEYFVDGDPAKGFNSALFIGAAQTYIDVSFGADGRAEGNAQAGKTIFAGDGDANSQAFEIYMQGAGATGKPDSGNAADTAVDHAKTNLTIDVEGKEVGVDAYQLDANTIVGIAQDGTPVFTLHLDPETGELTLTQYHQMHNADGSDANDPTNLKGVDAEGNEYDLIHFRGTDYDGDHVDGKLDISFIDDAPKVTCEDVTGKVAESALHDGNRDNPWQSAVATGSLASTVDFGADKDGTFKVNLTDAARESLENQHLTTHDGVELQYKVDGNGVLVGYTTDSHGHEHDVFTLEVDANGDFKFTLKDQIDHPGYGQDIKEIDFSGVITATDSDGDSVVLKNGQFEIKVEDDKPVSTCRTVDGTVDESALSDGNREGYWQHASTSGSLKNTVDFGADNHGKFSVDLSQSAKHNLESQGLSSHGQELHYTMQNGVLVGYTGSPNHPHVVFTLTVDSDGDYKFELKDQLDHIGRGNGDVIDIDFSDIIKATDEDGDSIHLNNGQFEVHVKDDQPVSTCRTVDGTVDESALSDGNRDNPWQTKVAYGHLGGTVDFGADNHGKFSIDLGQSAKQSLESQHLTSHGQELHYTMQGGTLVAFFYDHGQVHQVFTLTVDSEGNYKFELKDQLDHADHGRGDDVIDIDFSGIIKATDEDGDSIHLNNGQFEVHVKDDQPVATCNNVDGTVDESALSDGNKEGNWQHSWTAGSLKSAVDFGADNHGKFSIDLSPSAQQSLESQHLTSHGQELHYTMQGGTLVAFFYDHGQVHQVFTLTVDNDGNYKFELKDQLDHVGRGNDNTIDIDFSGIIKATDEDGDSIHLNNGQFEIHVNDDQPVATCNNVDSTVDESALSDGNRENPWQTKVAYGHLAGAVDFGADNHGKFSIDLGQSAKQSLESQHLTSHGQELHYTMQGGTLVAFFYDHGQAHEVFTLTVDSDGDYKFELKDQLDHVGRGNGDVIDIDFSGIIKATDEDGDSIHLNNGQFEVHVKDDQPVATCNNVDGTVDESALSDGNREGGWQHASTTGSLKNTVDFGADNHGKFSIDLAAAQSILGHQNLESHGQDLHYKLSDDGHTLIGYTGSKYDPHVVFTLTVDSDGDYKFELKDQLDHEGRGNDDVIDLDFSGIITATDEDGDSIHLNNGQFEIHVKDDQPVSTCRDVDGTVDESALSDGNREGNWQTRIATGHLSGAVDFGADNHGHFSIDFNAALVSLGHQNLESHGQGLNYMMQGDTLVGYTGSKYNPHVVFTLTVDSDGDYKFELKDQLDHKGPGNDNTIDIDFSDVIKATDEDGDSIHLNDGQFEIHVKDDQPVATCNNVDGTVDESALSDGNKEGNWQRTSTMGSLAGTVDFGADNHGKFSIDLAAAQAILGNQNLESHGQDLHYKMQGDTLVGYTGTANNPHVVFTLTVDETAITSSI